VCTWQQQQDVKGGRGGGPDNLFELDGSSVEGKLHNEYGHVFTAAAAVAVWVVRQIIPWNFPLLMAAWKGTTWHSALLFFLVCSVAEQHDNGAQPNAYRFTAAAAAAAAAAAGSAAAAAAAVTV
jgi:hypothetical protein